MARLSLKFNGEINVFDAPLTVSGLLSKIGLEKTQVAVELNRDIIDRDVYDTRQLAEGDEIEIVRFVGGGY